MECFNKVKAEDIFFLLRSKNNSKPIILPCLKFGSRYKNYLKNFTLSGTDILNTNTLVEAENTHFFLKTKKK